MGQLTHTIAAIKEIRPGFLAHVKGTLIGISPVEHIKVSGKYGPSRETNLRRGEIVDATGKIKVNFWGETGASLTEGKLYQTVRGNKLL